MNQPFQLDSAPRETVDVYTDGSVFPNPGNGSWAFVVPAYGVERAGCCPDTTTNNRMELQAVIEALKAIPGNLRIHSDSQWTIGVLSQNWKAKANLDLIAEGKALMANRKVAFKWVRGHNGDPHNERADFLAGQQRRG